MASCVRSGYDGVGLRSHAMKCHPTPFVLNCSRVGGAGGLRTFANELMNAMIDHGLECRALLPADYSVPPGVQATLTPASLAGNSRASLVRPIKWLAYSRFGLPIRRDQRVLGTTHHVLPGRSKQIVTIHDLRPYFLPDTPVQRFYFHHMLPRALNRCDGILTVSQTSKQLIAEVYKVSLDRIAVVPNAIRRPVPGLLAPRTPPRPYLLAIGASWAHKNIESLLTRYPIWSECYSLKIVGGRGQYRSSLEVMASSLGIANRIEFLSNLSTEQLDELYAGCSALVYPSKDEGFGLPPLEAMARMRPVIVADIPVFRELYGPYAFYVQLNDETSWHQAFSALERVGRTELEAARDYAFAYDRDRMFRSLQTALSQFWPL